MTPSAKWDPSQQGLRRVTAVGWTTGSVGLAALAVSALVTWNRQRELRRQTVQRDQLRAIADAEVRLALSQITWPFFTLFGDDSEEAVLALAPAHIEDPSRLATVMRVDIRSKDRPFPGGTFDVSWAEVLKMNADRGAARIDRAMQIYAGYLEPSVLEALSELRTSEFLVLRLQRLDEYVEMNREVALLEFPFSGPGEF
jgi:hypothetical protein